MPERAIKTFDAEAQEYFIRGMSAARGGQRLIAARLLREAVRLNPYHEQAWLWLSGVLDDQDDIIYCLRSVLDINPHNQRARIGLERLSIAPPASAGSLFSVWDDENTVAYTRPQPGARSSWWTQWREAKAVWLLVRRTVWLIPLLLIAATIVLRTILTLQPLPHFPTYRDLEAPAPTGVAVGALVATEATTPPASPLQGELQLAALNRYWSDIAATRTELQAAVSAYREQTEQSRTTVERAAAARILVEKLDRAQTTFVRLTPPPGTRDAHTTYLEGLTEERQAMEDLLTFYSNDEVIYANRAGVRLQTARIKITEALAAWNQYARETATVFGGTGRETGR